LKRLSPPRVVTSCGEPDAPSRDERLAVFKADHGVTPSDIIHEVRVAFS
jgi:hypothetical protein